MGLMRGSSYYTIVDGPTWTKAEANANALGGHLVTINDAEKNEWIMSNISRDVGKNGYWIGLNDLENEGIWVWSSGQESNYRNWFPGNPNNHSGWDGGDEDAAVLVYDGFAWGPNLDYSSLWNDGDTDDGRFEHQLRGIAEIYLSYFSIADATFREGKGGDVTITRTGGTSTSQTLKIVSSDGSATLSDDDYAQVNKTVTFAAGETSKTINISTTADLNVESDESFSLTMKAEGSDDVPPQITDGSATVTIKADDFKKGNSLYTIVDGPSWKEAQTSANRAGGNLVSISSQTENDFIIDIARQTNEHTVWIGLRYNQQSSKWEWQSGDSVDYSNWDSTQPELNHHLNEYYVGLLSGIGTHPEHERYGKNTGKWHDYPIGWWTQATKGIAEIPLKIPPTYTLSTSTSTIDEESESSVRFNISTTDVDADTRLYYTVSDIGTGITSSDFSSGDIKSSRLIGSDGKATFVLSAAADKTTEGDESFNVKLYTDSQRTKLVATSDSVSISDTSTTPKPTYSLSLDPTSIDEGDSFRASIETTNLDSGTKLYYAIKGDVDSSDFSSSLTDNVSINDNGKASFSNKAIKDLSTEGSESFNIKLYSNSNHSKDNLLLTSDSISISDTSITPAPKPTYSLSLSPSAIDEGDSFRASIETTNLDSGTKLYYAIKGDVNSSDFSSPLAGSIAVNDNGNASFTNKAIKDLYTEGKESADVVFYTDSQRTLKVAKDSLDIKDTSTTPKKASYDISFSSDSLKEGDLLSTSISTENLDPGSTLYWDLSGNGIDAADFSAGFLSGKSNINKSGSFSLTHSIAADLTTEGKEQLSFQLFSDENRNSLLAQKKLDIADTSITQQSASLRSASVNASTLNLLFDSALDDTKPNHDRFSITADGKPINISSSSLNATAGSLKLNLTSAIKPNQNVRLTYNDLNGDQSSGVLQTPNGTDLSSFSTTATNTSSDDTPPSISSATINGKTLSLSFSEALTQDFPRNQSWTLKQDGKAISIKSSSIDAAGAQLNLTLAEPVDRATNVTLAYNDLNGNQKSNVIQDLAGNDLASFSNFNVENQTTRSSEPLNIDTAEIYGDEIILAFDRELDSTPPSKGTFRISANGKPIKATRILLYPNDREAVLKLASPVAHSDIVKLSYKDAQGNQKKNIIQDIDGNDLASINNLLLTNNTRKSAKNFQLDYADANGKIINLYLNDSLSSSIPKASSFRVTANDKKQTINSITTQPKEGLITLNLKQSINPKQDILISYRDLNGDQSSGTAEDTDGNDLASFNNISPLNDSIDNDPPRLEDAFLDGKELTLEFDELLQSGKVNNSRFKLKAGNKRIRISSALVPKDDAIAILTLRSPLPSKASSLSFTYRDLKGDQSSLIIQDTDGNDLPSLRNFQVELISGDNNFTDLA